MQTITLNNGVEMPAIGFGTYQVKDEEECERVVCDAVGAGYRLIDTARNYRNEEAVGRAIKNCGVPRNRLFVTTKIWFKDYESPDTENAVMDSLKKLGLDWLDLVLIHQPFANYYAAWRTLERLQKAGLVRAIGVSNFDSDRLVDLCNFNEVVPQVNQIETHLFCQRESEHEWMKKLGVAHEAWTPLARGMNDLFTNPVLAKIAESHQKTVPQVILRSLVQRGIVPIPKSTHRERMEENIAVFDFSLSDGEMAQIATLDTKKPFSDHTDPNMVMAALDWDKM